MTIAFLNGEYMPLSEAKISPMDRGFLFGDGIYEVIPTYSGSAVGFKGHTSRMAQGQGVPGEVLDDALTVACGEGAVELLRLQRAGKGAQDRDEFLRGWSINAGTRI